VIRAFWFESMPEKVFCMLLYRGDMCQCGRIPQIIRNISAPDAISEPSSLFQLKQQQGTWNILTCPFLHYSVVNVCLKNAVFSDVASFRYCVKRRFGGTYRLLLQGIRNQRARNQREHVTGHQFI
jgi:hypothetical protein